MLEDLCQIPITDGTHQTPTYSDEENGVPFISSKDVTSQRINWNNIKYITKELHDKLYARIAPQKNDILLAKNGTTGVAAIVEDSRVFDIYVTLAVLRPSNNISPQYLHKIINSSFCKEQFNSHLTGIGLPNLHLTDIKKTIVPLPPFSEQLRIDAQLEKWFAIIDKLEEDKDNLSSIIQQTKSKILDLAIHGKLVPQDPNDEPAIELLKRINPKFTPCDNAHYENIPSSWSWASLGEVCELITGSTPSKLHTEYYGGNFPFYKPSDLDAGRHVTIPSEFLTDAGKNVSRVIPVGTTAICCIGSIGKCGYIEKEGTTNQQINSAIPSKALHSLYLYYFCTSPFFIDELTADSSAITISIVNKSKLSKLLITLPPYKEQVRIVKRIEELFAILDNISAEL